VRFNPIDEPTFRVTIVGLLLILFTSLAPAVAAAGARESLCVDAFSSSREIRFTGVDQPDFRREVEEVLPRLETLLGTELDLSVQFTSNTFYSDAFYLPDLRSVKIGVRLDGRTTQARTGVFVHEATHSYSTDAFRYLINGQWYPRLAAKEQARIPIHELEADSEYRALVAKRNQLADVIHRETRRENNPAFDAVVAEFQTVRAEQEARIKKAATDQKILAQKTTLYRAYHELFSDAMAALVTKNKGVIADALGIATEGPYVGQVAGASNRRKNPTGTRPRAFEINRFKEWAPENKFGNEYTILDPARGVLWELYLKNLPDSMAAKFVEVFRLASEREVERLYQIGADENLVVSPPPKDLNQEFLRVFREIAKEKGLRVYRKP
jgi:hypothetical protein